MEKKYSIEEIEKVQKELKKGKTHKEIVQGTGINGSKVNEIKSLLVQLGRITDEEIEKAKSERTKKFLMTDPRMQKIMKYVRSGLSQTDIAQIVGCTQYVVGYNIRKFIRYGLITQEEVSNARQEYLKEIKYDNFRREEVLEQLSQGRLKNHFAPELGLTGSGVRVIQDSLIEEGRITKAEIEEAVATKGEAAQMIEQGYNLEVIEQRTKLSIGDLIELKNRKLRKQEIGSNNKKATDFQGDDEFPDL